MAISPVRELGLRYWRDGAAPDQNAPHLEPVDYWYHGTMTRVFVGQDIDYQDTFIFRADFGGQTGTARVTIAGSVILTL